MTPVPRLAVLSAFAGALLGAVPILPAAAEVWAACGITTSDTKIVRSFSRYRAAAQVPYYLAGGTSALVCGDSSYGYRHIKDRHLAEWERDAAVVRSNWRDHADFAIATTLSDPDRTSYRTRNDTFCFQRLIYLVDRSTGRQVGTRTILVSVASGFKNVITAHPTSTGMC